MTQYFAHAVGGESSSVKIKGGKAGDQTGGEVKVGKVYFGTWQYVLRIVDDILRRQFGNNMLDIARNNKIGYDQGGRNTLLTEAEKVGFDFSKIKTKCECDCSSAATIALLGAIYVHEGEEAYEKAKSVLVVDGNCASTRTIRGRLQKLNLITVYKSKAYTGSSKNAVFGDMYLTEGRHIAAYVSAGKKYSTTTGGGKRTATEKARKFKESLSGTYVSTGAVNVRNGAGTKKNKYGDNKEVFVTIPEGTTVTCYGYYTAVGTRRWLYVQFKYKSTTYTGFISSKYLKKA